jgi:hypothetical protein
MRSRKTVKRVVMEGTEPVTKMKAPDKCIDYSLDAVIFLAILGRKMLRCGLSL